MERKREKLTKTLVAICGKGCSGKDFFLKTIMDDPAFAGKLHRVISSTTRPKRAGEVDGKDYHFTSPASFFDQDLLTHTTFKGDWHYGIAASEMLEGVNIAIVNNFELQQLEGSHMIVVPVFMDTPAHIIFKRMFKRDNGWEKVRRFVADSVEWRGFTDYICDNFYYRLILDGRHSSWYNRQVLRNYLSEVLDNF